MYNPHPKRKLLADMDKTQLLSMREQGMSNAEIALAVGVSKPTIYRMLGKQPEEITKARNASGYVKMAQTRFGNKSEGGYTVERKAKSYMPRREEEPVKAVLAVKKSPIRLSGAFMHYTICPDREMIDVETEEGRTLIQVPADMLDTFIKELTAIQKNMNTAQSVPFWG